MHPSHHPGLVALAVNVPAIVPEAAVRFYVDELGYFEPSHDWGFGCVSLRLRASGNSHIHIMPRNPGSFEPAHIELLVADVYAEFNRLRATGFISGARVETAEVCDYPTGPAVSLIDPSGNRVVLQSATPYAADPIS